MGASSHSLNIDNSILSAGIAVDISDVAPVNNGFSNDRDTDAAHIDQFRESDTDAAQIDQFREGDTMII
jgi:hypothetical protein